MHYAVIIVGLVLCLIAFGYDVIETIRCLVREPLDHRRACLVMLMKRVSAMFFAGWILVVLGLAIPG